MLTRTLDGLRDCEISDLLKLLRETHTESERQQIRDAIAALGGPDYNDAPPDERI